MSGKASRRKGLDFERHIASLLRDIFPHASRGQQTQGGTQQAPDVDNTPYYIECKKGKKTNIKGAFQQALEATMSYAHRTHTSPRAPVAITQDDRSHLLVTMSFMDWKALLKKAYGETDG